jgi:hypothetical protein
LTRQKKAKAKRMERAMHLLEKPGVVRSSTGSASRLTTEKSWRRLIAVNVIALAVIVSAALRIEAQARSEPNPQMVSIEEYLMEDKGAEISLARSAAQTQFLAMQQYSSLEKVATRPRLKGRMDSRAWLNAHG